jgi:rRNA processing protein Krr1/Pno1
METLLLQKIRSAVSQWRDEGCPHIFKETRSILSYIRRVAYLHEPQIEALETYIYLKEVIGNKTSIDLFRSLFADDKELLLGLGVSKEKAFDLIGDDVETELFQLLSYTKAQGRKKDFEFLIP